MSGGGVNAEENLNRLDEHHIAAHLFHKPTRVLTPHGTLVDVFMMDPTDPSMEIRRQRLEPYLRREVPAGHVGTTKFNIKLKWLRTRLQQMPLDLEDNGLMQYARCYILYLLGGVLLPDKANNTVHVRYLPLLADYDAICTYSWGSTILCWLYRAMCLATDPVLRVWPVVIRCSCRGYTTYYLFWHRMSQQRIPYMDPRILSRVPAKFLGHPHGDFYMAVVPLIFFRWIEILNVDRLARNDDGWWPIRLSEWFEVWANQRSDAYRLRIDRADTSRPSQDYYRWYCDRTRRFLSAPDAFHDPRQEVVPAGAPEEYGRGPVVNLPPVPRDHRRRRPRRCRVEEDADPGEDRPDVPVEDRPEFEPDMGYPPQPPPVPGDYYHPQPFVQPELTQPSSIQHFMPYHSSYEVGGSSQGGTQDLIDSIDRVGWTNFSSFFDASPHTPTDLALALPRSDTETQPTPAGRRATSICDTAGSALRPYDAMQMQGRRLSYTGADVSVDEDEGHDGRPGRVT
ncbi:hypothetical protein Ahy_B08g089112 [Arachis hypogaea]|uniref:Aminotransferase-like plant mobile domain-containing protein n=1 Tax=Arachis hypogaea TaxID=3818 RepID=A0A444XXJ8_ARAHY|nr:hypothetical protein Ahy_B08g089112 [Arachis hypogaea]